MTKTGIIHVQSDQSKSKAIRLVKEKLYRGRFDRGFYNREIDFSIQLVLRYWCKQGENDEIMHYGAIGT